METSELLGNTVYTWMILQESLANKFTSKQAEGIPPIADVTSGPSQLRVMSALMHRSRKILCALPNTTGSRTAWLWHGCRQAPCTPLTRRLAAAERVRRRAAGRHVIAHRRGPVAHDVARPRQGPRYTLTDACHAQPAVPVENVSTALRLPGLVHVLCAHVDEACNAAKFLARAMPSTNTVLRP